MTSGSSKFIPAAIDLAHDAATAQIYASLTAEGVEAILLKGFSTRGWSRAADPSHHSLDIDLLVSPPTWLKAEEVLAGIGYGPSAARPSHAVAWLRSDHVPVDLHHTLAGVSVDGETVWRILSQWTETTRIAGSSIRVLAKPAIALHLALHAAQNGASDLRTVGALGAALDELPVAVWRDAAGLASRLGAMRPSRGRWR